MSFLKPDQTSPTSGLESVSTLKSNTYKNSAVSEYIVVLTPDQTNRMNFSLGASGSTCNYML